MKQLLVNNYISFDDFSQEIKKITGMTVQEFVNTGTRIVPDDPSVYAYENGKYILTVSEYDPIYRLLEK